MNIACSLEEIFQIMLGLMQQELDGHPNKPLNYSSNGIIHNMHKCKNISMPEQ
jgi:hypothetical protein